MSDTSDLRPARFNENCCGAEIDVDERYVVCTRPVGHAGDHAAHGLASDKPLSVWPQ